MRRCVALFAAISLLVWCARAMDAQAEFATANQLYEQGKYAEAAARYHNVITNGVATASTWFNLGNAEFKAERLGHAIAAYRRAEQRDPRDTALRANLNFARKKAAGEDLRLPVSKRVLRFLSPNEWAVCAAVALAGFFLVLSAFEIRRARKQPGLLVGLGLLAVSVSVCAASSYRDRYVSTEAVVVAKQAAVRYGPLEDSQTAFSLNDGAEVSVLDSTAQWLQVRDASDRIGWARREDLVTVTP